MFGGVNLFLLKTGSRNQFNNQRKDGYFLEHYHRMWGIRLPQMDAVNDVLQVLDNDELEQVKMDMMSGLFEQK